MYNNSLLAALSSQPRFIAAPRAPPSLLAQHPISQCPWGQATHPLACQYSTDALGQSHTVSPSLPPAPLRPSSAGPRRREGRQGPQPSAPTLIAYARARALSLLATKVRRLLPAVNCTCSSTSVHRLPPRCSLLAAKVRCCPTGPTLSPRPAPHLPSPLGEAGAGRRRRARPARAGGGGPQWGGRERGREGETV